MEQVPSNPGRTALGDLDPERIFQPFEQGDNSAGGWSFS